MCSAHASGRHHSDERGVYWRCTTCALVFLSRAGRPAYDDEIARYELHRNDAADPRYLKFLSRLADPMIERVPPGARGLDYGSGTAPALGLLMSRSGRPAVSYDPAFRPDESLLHTTYDFLTCSEVLEHVHEPMALLQRFRQLVIPGGWIGIMTSFYPATAFGQWWYRRDPTHVCFYHQETMRWIARHFDWSVELPAANVAVFRIHRTDSDDYGDAVVNAAP